MKELWLRCACHYHVMHLECFEEHEEDKELYISFGLNHYLPWWKRVVLAVKYIFGWTTDEGFFAGMVLFDEGIGELRDYINDISS